MEILKHGRLPKYVATCPRCGCVFSFLEPETVLSWPGPGRYIPCPECYNRIQQEDFKEMAE